MSPSTRLRVAALCCVAALVLVGGFGVVGAQDGGANETSLHPQAAGDLALPERVVLPGEQTTGSVTPSPDVGAALHRGGTNLDGAYERYLLEERLAHAPDDATRRDILNRTVSDLNESVRSLGDRERTARQQFVDGQLTATDYVRQLAAIDRRARELEARAERIDPIDPRMEGYADQYDARTASSELETIRGDLIARHGEVRALVSGMLAGERDTDRIYVTAADEGSVLSTITARSYHREATRDDVLVGGTQRGIGLDEVIDLTEEDLYNQYWSFYDFNTVGRGVTGQLYLVLGEGERTYEHGVLRSYVDAVSRNVFWEYQRLDLSENLPRASPITNSTDSLSLAVAGTYATGPAEVTVIEEGTPVANATITVDGTPVAETDGDGQAWVVLPYGDPTVAVTHGNTTASVHVQWNEAGNLPSTEP